jgi:hypothetical protein
MTIVIIAIALAMSSVQPAQSAALRSGTVIGGWFPFAVVLAPGGTPECSWNVDCHAWLTSGCQSALAGHDPGLHASIVNVANLAGSRTKRVLKLYPQTPGIMLGGVAIEFWGRSCNEILPYPSIPVFTSSVRFKIPYGVRWMTIASVDTTTFKWRMR